MTRCRSLLVLALMMVSAFACTKSTKGPKSKSGAEPPLAFALPLFNSSETFELANQHGKVVVLDVWATWCAPCVEGMQLYEQLSRQYRDKPVLFVGLNVDTNPALIAPFLKEVPVTFPILLDKDALVASKTLNVETLPTTFIIDKQGRVREVHEGFNSDVPNELPVQIEKLLREPFP